LDELMALMKIMDFVEAKEFDRYILDMAPTGHALRFLEMPGLMRQWFIAFFKLLIKYQGIARLGQVAELLRKQSKQLRQVQQLLTDPHRCQSIVVTIAEAMAVLETERLLRRLVELNIACPMVVANMVMPPTECASCTAIRGQQQGYLETLRGISANLIEVPLFNQEVRGLGGLTQVAEAIYGDHNGRENE